MKDFDINLYSGNKAKELFEKLKHYVYALSEIDSSNIPKPFYVGKGVGDRCLQHLKEINTSKARRIKDNLMTGKFTIEILRHGLDDKTAQIIEAACIDLLNIRELENKVRGSGAHLGRMPLEELYYLYAAQSVEILPEHTGLLFILNKTYKSGMNKDQIYEATRGVWANVPRDDSIQYAYASYHGIIKEVYKIKKWFSAGTTKYLHRNFDDRPANFLSNRFEFIGDLASDKIRERYKGKFVNFPRSFGSPFVRVGK